MSSITPATWQPDDAAPPLLTALGRGLRGRCPVCGQSRMFSKFLRVVERCPHCGAPLGAARADDAPPYVVILLVGHVIVAGMLVVEKTWAPPLWVHMALWIPLTIGLSLALIQPVKGATVGLLVRLGLVQDQADGR